MFKRSWNRIPAPDTGRTFITFVVKLVLFAYKDRKLTKKEPVGPI